MDHTTIEDGNVGCDIVDRAVEVWKKAQVLYQSPSWEGRPEARAFAERIATDFQEGEHKLVKLLEHENQLVVAYALLTLQLMGSRGLRALPAELLERRSKITLRTGSFSTSMDLGGLARQFQKSQSASASGDPD
jgi:hypothetical protein